MGPAGRVSAVWRRNTACGASWRNPETTPCRSWVSTRPAATITTSSTAPRSWKNASPSPKALGVKASTAVPLTLTAHCSGFWPSSAAGSRRSSSATWLAGVA